MAPDPRVDFSLRENDVDTMATAEQLETIKQSFLDFFHQSGHDVGIEKMKSWPPYLIVTIDKDIPALTNRRYSIAGQVGVRPNQ